MVKQMFSVKEEDFLAKSMTFIEESLKKMNIKSKLLVRAELLAEEVIVSFANHGPEDMYITICIKKKLGDICIEISAYGAEFDLGELNRELTDDMSDPDQESAIRSIILKAHGEKLKYSHSKGVNRVSIAAGKADRSSIIKTFIALILGLLVGIGASLLLPKNVSEGMCTYVLNPVKTMFMSALRIIVAPVIFFSIASCISQFKNLSELGRIGAKVMSMYLMTTVIAAFIALGYSLLFTPGQDTTIATTAATAVNVDTNVDSSLLSTIINIVPDNLIKPFLESNTLQLIFLAVVFGLALGMIGEYSATLKNLFEACNELFLTITTLITRFIPLAAFCSVTILIIEMGFDALISTLGMFGTALISIASMMLVYAILVMIIAKLNPLKFYSNAREAMLTSFALSSSSASMPTTLNTCTNKLGISPKLASFSIPLGATVNMDGATMSLIVGAMFLARVYGVELSAPTIGAMIFTVIMLSLGSPGVPGAGIVCMGIVLEHIGVPIEALSLILAINPFLDMFSTMNNVLGDVAVSTIVAKSEGLLDKKIYNS